MKNSFAYMLAMLLPTALGEDSDLVARLPNVAARRLPSTRTFGIYNFVAEKKSWFDARAHCESMGKKLATICNAEENTKISMFLSHDDTNKFWVGLNDLDTEGTFEWDSGSSCTYRSWNTGEPNNDGPGTSVEHCTHIFQKDGKTVWNDLPCDYKNYFVCESEREVPACARSPRNGWMWDGREDRNRNCDHLPALTHGCDRPWMQTNCAKTCGTCPGAMCANVVNARDHMSGAASCASQLTGTSTCKKYLGYKDCDLACGLCACSTGTGSKMEHCSGHGTCEATCTKLSCADATCKCDEGYTGAKCEMKIEPTPAGEEDECPEETSACIGDEECFTMVLAMDEEPTTEQMLDCMGNDLCVTLMTCHVAADPGSCTAETMACIDDLDCITMVLQIREEGDEATTEQIVDCVRNPFCADVVLCHAEDDKETGYKKLSDWTEGFAAGEDRGCSNLGCHTTSSGTDEERLEECQNLCDDTEGCNVINFIPTGADGTSGVGRCCRRECVETPTKANGLLWTNWAGWDVYELAQPSPTPTRRIVIDAAKKMF